jgi:bifunctional ADP-heptose synthase (sugar kinase/adenylyltransferase)
MSRDQRRAGGRDHGAGDAFNGGFAVALSEGRDVVQAVRFGSATAGISVTRAGAAAAMPRGPRSTRWRRGRLSSPVTNPSHSVTEAA